MNGKTDLLRDLVDGAVKNLRERGSGYYTTREAADGRTDLGEYVRIPPLSPDVEVVVSDGDADEQPGTYVLNIDVGSPAVDVAAFVAARVAQVAHDNPEVRRIAVVPATGVWALL